MAELVLYFDVNQTILMVDPVANKTVPAVVNEILAGNVFGNVTDGEWSVTADSDSERAPYDWFISSMRHKRPDVPRDATPEQKQLLAKQAGEQRDKGRHLVSHFTSPGQPGEQFRAAFD